MWAGPVRAFFPPTGLRSHRRRLQPACPGSSPPRPSGLTPGGARPGTPAPPMVPFRRISPWASWSMWRVAHRRCWSSYTARSFPAGTLLLSVPWINGTRRVLAPLVRRRQAHRRAAGDVFYQYAFSRRELRDFLTGAGFSMRGFHRYSPGRGARELMSLLGRQRPVEPTPKHRPQGLGRGGRFHGLLRRLPYTPPVLWAFAHMILAVAHKPADTSSAAGIRS